MNKKFFFFHFWGKRFSEWPKNEISKVHEKSMKKNFLIFSMMLYQHKGIEQSQMIFLQKILDLCFSEKKDPKWVFKFYKKLMH